MNNDNITNHNNTGYSILLLLFDSESLSKSRTKLNIKHQTNNLHLNNYDWDTEYLTIGRDRMKFMQIWIQLKRTIQSLLIYA